ncbi:hypothetical protein AB0L63_19405 [Nocardia sp. NPDC051990]|uniref:hypothetical protein n=1 Tax=Nocardia sp. NPDC051990 TaxID=3155285 RepID=UPI00341DAEB4
MTPDAVTPLYRPLSTGVTAESSSSRRGATSGRSVRVNVAGCPLQAAMPSTDIGTADQCGWYRRVLELPVVVVPRTRRIVVRRIDGLLDAVVMPSPLGEKVATWLAMDRQLGPVIEHRDTARTTFVTGPADGYEHTIFATLLRLNVGLGGTHIVLPSPDDGGSGIWRWLFLPCNGFRPVMRIVLDAVVAVSAR